MSAIARHERLCIACRQMRPRAEMFRLGRQAGQTAITINDTGSSCGKGFYICRQSLCLKKLQCDKKLRKLFSTKISPDTVAELEKRLCESGLISKCEDVQASQAISRNEEVAINEHQQQLRQQIESL